MTGVYSKRNSLKRLESCQSMKVLQVSTADVAGGAESIARGLFQEYGRIGHHSWLAVGIKRSDHSKVFLMSRSRWSTLCLSLASKLKLQNGRDRFSDGMQQLLHKVSNPIHWIRHTAGHEDYHFPGTWKVLNMTPQKPDIVHCHNLHGPIVPGGGYFDLRALPWLCRNVPVVLTLHDAWLLSGHCAHSFGCMKWQTGCGRCPDLNIYPAIPRDGTAHNWRQKQKIYNQCHVNIATPSQWLMEKVKASMLKVAIKEARVIPNGVDVATFRVGLKNEARSIIGIPSDAAVLLFVGNKIRINRWKDFRTLQSAVPRVAARLPEQRLILLCLGEERVTERIGRAEIWFHGYHSDPKLVAKYYSASDVYVHSAHVDTFPNTVLEAMACGRPVVATRVGGIPEQIEDGITGFLTNPGDALQLADCIHRLLTDDELREQMGHKGAKTVRHQFSFERQVRAYLNWYHEILQNYDKP